MNNQPLVTIITPVYNGEGRVGKTIESVLVQTYKNIEYIVVDGSSRDKTSDVVQSYGASIVQFISEKDNGLYDALAKGFAQAKGEIIGYINAGDFLYPHAIQVAVDIMTTHNVDWVTGCRSVCNSDYAITSCDLPFRYTNSLISSGSYGQVLPFIQQESTFWRKSLLDELDVNRFRKFKYAGDYFLWWSFAKRANLEIVSSPLGVFCKHEGQLSENIDSYFDEIAGFARSRSLITRIKEIFELCIWALHPKLRAKFFRTIYKYNGSSHTWIK